MFLLGFVFAVFLLVGKVLLSTRCRKVLTPLGWGFLIPVLLGISFATETRLIPYDRAFNEPQQVSGAICSMQLMNER